MTRENLLREIERMVEVAPGTLRGPEELGGLPGWDSMTQLTFIVHVERALGLRVPATRVAACRTVHDLLALVEPKPRA
jgi:acyl carrier protein